jgi:hypothetical protein
LIVRSIPFKLYCTPEYFSFGRFRLVPSSYDDAHRFTRRPAEKGTYPMLISSKQYLGLALLAPAWITAIRAGRSSLEVDLAVETIRNSPEYDPATTIDRGYEERLFEHYGRPGYWR